MKLSSWLMGLGILITLASAALILLTFFPIIFAELQYIFNKPNANATVLIKSSSPNISPDTEVVYPVDEGFSIVIPKIGVNSKVIPGVDPFNDSVYQTSLTKGVAQAKGTSFPTDDGNIFIFAHSAANPYDAVRFNSVFYLLNKLTTGDKIYVSYNQKIYSYKVTNTEVIDPSSVSYLGKGGPGKTITLMTCWPAGLSFKRLLVFGEMEQN